MASSCITPYASCPETTHFARICRIVVDILRDILWQVLTHEVKPADLPIQVSKYQYKLKSLDVKIKTWLVGISHSSSEIPSAEKFDVSSLYTLIRNLCSTIPTPTTQWGNTPPASGITLGDDIERIREFRNTLYGHATQAKIDTADFNNICTDINDAVSRFDVYFSANCKAMKCNFKSDIDTVLTCSMDKTLEDEYIEKWKEIVVLFDHVKEQVDGVGNAVCSAREEVTNLKHHVNNACQNVRDVQQDIDIARQEVNIVNQKVGDVKEEVVNVNRKVGDVEENVDNVKQYLLNVQKEVPKINQEVVDVKQEVGSVMQKVCEVTENVSDIRQEVGYSRQEVGSVKQEVTNVKQEVSSVTQTILDVKQDVSTVKKEVGIVKQEVGSVHQEVGNVKQELGNVYQKVGDVKQNVGDVNRQVGDVKEAIGNVKKHVGDVKQHLKILQNEAGVKQEVGDVNMNLEILHDKVDVLKKDDLQTKECGTVSGESKQQISLDKIHSRSSQVDKDQSNAKMAVPLSVQSPKDSEHEKQDQNPETDIRFIECIKESNFRNIGVLLKNRMFPSKRTIIHAIKEHGYNKGIQCLLRGMSNVLRKQISDAISVWSGYRTQDLHTPVFVVMFSKTTIIPEKMKFSKPYDDYEIVFRNEHTPNDEEENISEQSEINDCTIDKEDIARVLDCIAKSTERLMNEHSNLSIIAPSTIKAMGFNGCFSKRKRIQSMCIVLYVPLKGIIPVSEKEFPKDIDGICTDVREGEFVFHGRKEARKWHPNLPMGCRISTRDRQSGTLGGFVDLPGDKTGCITAAHVVLNEKERRNYVKFKKAKKVRYNASLAQGQTMIEIYQPTCTRAAFGNVSQIAFEEGNTSTPSVDAAVIEITDHKRTPFTGMFPSGNYPVIGFTKENPMMYNSGKTRDHSDISRGSTVVKYGCFTNITHGKLVWNGSSVRFVNTGGKSWNRLKAENISYPKFFNQMVVKSSDKINFSVPGDSGALVFTYRTSSRDLEAIGLLIGATTHRSPAQMHIVTPIQAVFQQLGLGNVMFKRFPDIKEGEQNLGMNDIRHLSQLPEIHHEISETRINELREELKEVLRKEIKETTTLEINAIKREIKEEMKEIRATVIEQINANKCSLE